MSCSVGICVRDHVISSHAISHPIWLSVKTFGTLSCRLKIAGSSGCSSPKIHGKLHTGVDPYPYSLRSPRHPRYTTIVWSRPHGIRFKSIELASYPIISCQISIRSIYHQFISSIYIICQNGHGDLVVPTSPHSSFFPMTNVPIETCLACL